VAVRSKRTSLLPFILIAAWSTTQGVVPTCVGPPEGVVVRPHRRLYARPRADHRMKMLSSVWLTFHLVQLSGEPSR
jgi:hypothetical protein